MTDDTRIDLGPRNRAALSHIAARMRGEMDVAKALKVVKRYPCYSIYGGHNHAKLNEDIFDAENGRKALEEQHRIVAEEEAHMAEELPRLFDKAADEMLALRETAE